MAKTVTIHITAKPREVGLWCDRCLKPSKVLFGLYWLRDSGVSSMGTLVRCVERCEP